jgi:chemotaxis protein MotB
MRTLKMLVIMLGAATLLVGCTNSLKEENALLLDENQTLRAQLEERNTALESINQELRDRNIAISELQRDLDDTMRQPVTPVASTPTTGFEGIEGVSGAIEPGEITAIVESDILFDSGKSTLKPEARRTLDAVSDVLNRTYATKTIRIEGHTDSDPIRKSGFKSNYHLGFERSVAVREYLASRGVDAARIYLASYGPDQPQATKAQSRRVEIVVELF